MDAQIRERLAAVLGTGSEADLAAWASTGAAGVLALREELEGKSVTEPARSAGPREIIDNLTAAAAAIAWAQPEAFLTAFAGDRWASDTFVLVGLGRIDDERATARLVAATSLPNEWARMDAAIGLAGRRSETVAAALVRLLDDGHYLVRYHALASLATSGTQATLPDLDRFEPLTEIERTMRDHAVVQISGRDSSGTPTN
jgi:HEAT repeat protein